MMDPWLMKLSSTSWRSASWSRSGRSISGASWPKIEDYDAEDLELARSEDFWRMIRLRRAGERSLPLAEVGARLETTGGKPAGKRAATRKGRKHS